MSAKAPEAERYEVRVPVLLTHDDAERLATLARERATSISATARLGLRTWMDAEDEFARRRGA